MEISITIPKEIMDGLDDRLKLLQENRQVKEYSYFAGNPGGVPQNKEYDDGDWTVSKGPVLCKRHQGTTWFRFKVQVPAEVCGIPTAGTAVRLQSFFLAPTEVYVDGELRLSERTWVDFKIPEIVLSESAVPGKEYTVAVKLDFGEYCYWDNTFSAAAVYDCVEEIEFEISSFKEELAYACRFKAVEDILPQVFLRISESLERNEGVAALVKIIRVSRDMLKPMEGEAKKNTVHLVGHAHIDMNWFWSMDETLDLVRRDFGTMLAIMEENPDFKFSQSQCATYEIAEKHYPAIFNGIGRFVKSGNWDVTASAWVEGDLNMASGEAIVRQILYSKKYLREKFNVDPRIMWCPDTFGHSANIPQILKKSGIDYYFFMRCGLRGRGRESDLTTFFQNRADNQLIRWRGLEGSEVLAFNSLYSALLLPANAVNISKKLKDQCGLKNSMYVYGTGDHGGGPTRRDIKNARKLDGYPTTPRMVFSTTHDFFNSIVEEGIEKLPVGEGELNSVFDGCYTTHADIKRYNRLCENRLVSTEAAGTMAYMHGLPYNAAQILDCWKKTLFNQFHDILDGSGVGATYEYSAMIAGESLEQLNVFTEKSLAYIADRISYSGKGIPVILFNTTGWIRSECIKIAKPEGSCDIYGAEDAGGNALAVQNSGEYIYLQVDNIPPVGYKAVYLMKDKKADNENGTDFGKVEDSGQYYTITTRYYDIEICKSSGEITTLYDKTMDRYYARREMTGWINRQGVLNTLQLHYETPSAFSAWTISPASSIKNLIGGAAARIVEDGPLVKIINLRHTFDNSTLSQDIKIYRDSQRIDFVTHVEWKEYGDFDRESPMLKAVFTPAVNNSCAVYEIPFGALERPNVDMEVPALNWISVSDDDCGFSLLNDCKYGHRVRGNVMEITLIRSGWQPDPRSDTGSHDFTYSILPHKGSWKEAGVIREGYLLNNPLQVVAAGGGTKALLPEAASYISVNADNIVLSAFKPAEEGDALILRIYEGAGEATQAEVTLGFDVESVQETDLMENCTGEIIACSGRKFKLNIGGFEVKTFRLKL